MRCPVCKADIQESPCRRCKADLSLLFALEEQHRHELAEARQCLSRGEWAVAALHAETADWLRSDDEAKRLTALARLLGRDFSAAWQAYQQWREARQVTG